MSNKTITFQPSEFNGEYYFSMKQVSEMMKIFGIDFPENQGEDKPFSVVCLKYTDRNGKETEMKKPIDYQAMVDGRKITQNDKQPPGGDK